MNRRLPVPLMICAGVGLFCLSVITPPPVYAQTTQPSSGSLRTMPYADYSFGFEMRLPAEWVYDRTRFVGPERSIGLIRGRDSLGRLTLQVLVFRDVDGVPFPEWLTRFEQQLTQIPGTKRIERRPWQPTGHIAAVLDVSARLGVADTQTYYLCVQFDADTIWMMAYGGPASGEAEIGEVRGGFEQIATALHVLYDPAQAKEIASAFEQGRVFLTRLRNAASRLKAVDTERYYDIILKGQPSGYLKCRMAHETRALDDPRYGGNRKEGLRISELSWQFSDNGAARCTRIDMFVSHDLESELIETQQTHVPAADNPVQKLVTSLDQCVREKEVLFSSYSTSLDRSLPDPRPPIKVGADYLPLAWLRRLPALLATQAGELHAFTVYESETRALITQTIRPLGPRELPGQPGTTAYAFETREGFVGAASTVYADIQGHLLRYESGELVVVLSNQPAIERKYGRRQEAAEARFLSGQD